MKHKRQITINCDTGLEEIMGIRLDDKGIMQQEWNGSNWENVKNKINFNHILSILKGEE